jgi:hypothetical protein
MPYVVFTLIIAGIAFAITFVGYLFASETAFVDKLRFSGMTAAIAGSAALLLCWRDRARHHRTRRAVRATLLGREDVSDADFLSQFPGLDFSLVSEVRMFVARFFDVPVEKIHPDDNLVTDLQLRKFEPGFHMFVLHNVIAARKIVLDGRQLIGFRDKSLAGIGEFVSEIDRILRGLRVASE